MILPVALVIPLVVAAALGTASPILVRRLPPSTAVLLLVGAALVTAVAGGFVLSVTAFSVVGQLSEVAALGHWSTQVLHRLSPVPWGAGIAAGMVVVPLFGASVMRTAAAARQLWLADASCRELSGVVQGLVVVADQQPIAYAVQGLRGRMIVSTGMLSALTPAERRVLIAHESSHLTNRHSLLVMLVEVAAAANPLLRPTVAAVRHGVERWADEDAARVVGDRRLTARTIARAGLACDAGRCRPRSEAGLAISGSVVAGRAIALCAPAMRPRRMLAALVVAVTVLTAGCALLAEHITENHIDLAQQEAAAGR